MDLEALITSIMPLAGTVELAATLLLTGLIWTIQLVHYPLFLRVGVEHLRAYEAAHCTRITWLVGPLMVIEAGAATVNLVVSHDDSRAVLGFGLLLAVWISTALVQIPLHATLSHATDPQQIAATIKRLVLTNWIRTAAWSLRAILLILGARTI